MHRPVTTVTIIGIVATAMLLRAGSVNATSPTLPSRAQIIAKMKLANDHFLAKWPDPCGNCLPGNRPSNIWTRAVYYEGALAYARLSGDTAAIAHAVRWGTFHQWNFRNSATTTNADDQCAGQSYIELYQIDGKPERLANVKISIDRLVNSASNAYWTWIDAIQMAMPVFAKLGALEKNDLYYFRMNTLFNYTRTSLGLYNEDDHLWWRDTTFKHAATPTGKKVYWSRGNGWVFAALARVLDILPAADVRREEYAKIFKDMAAAIKVVQRSDGFWNENLANPTHFGGPEVTGTGLFTFGIAWGVNNGLLDRTEFLPTIARAWNAIADSAIVTDGSIGYVQGTGDSPGDNGSGVNNVTPSRKMIPDFDDFGLGCVLLAGSETAVLAADATSARHSPHNGKTIRTIDISTQPGSRIPHRWNGSTAELSIFDLAGRNAAGTASINNAVSVGEKWPTVDGIFVVRVKNLHR